MTAYLQPGDKIHLQVPGTNTDMDRVVDMLRPIFASQGVEIVGNHSATGPGATLEIVAVFRKPDGGEE